MAKQDNTLLWALGIGAVAWWLYKRSQTVTVPAVVPAGAAPPPATTG